MFHTEPNQEMLLNMCCAFMLEKGVYFGVLLHPPTNPVISAFFIVSCKILCATLNALVISVQHLSLLSVIMPSTKIQRLKICILGL